MMAQFVAFGGPFVLMGNNQIQYPTYTCFNDARNLFHALVFLFHTCSPVYVPSFFFFFSFFSGYPFVLLGAYLFLHLGQLWNCFDIGILFIF